MATKIFSLKMYKSSSSSYPSIEPLTNSSYNYYKDSFRYNPRSLLTKNPRYNRFYAAYFAPSISSKRRSSSRIRKMYSPARSASSSSSSSSRSKNSTSPPPVKSTNSSGLGAKATVSPPPPPKSSNSLAVAKPAVPQSAEKPSKYSAPTETTVSPAITLLPKSSVMAEITNSTAPEKSPISPAVAKASVSPPRSRKAASLPPSNSLLSAPSQKKSASLPPVKYVSRPVASVSSLPAKELAKTPPSSVPSSASSSSGSSSVSSKRSRPDDENRDINSPKKRRISKKAAEPSKEEFAQQKRSDSLRKLRNLAAGVRKDSQRMTPAARRGLANVTGFSCYRNSLLQGLFHLPKFFNFLIDQHPVESCDVPKDCLACTLHLLASKYWTVGVPRKEITVLLRILEKQCDNLGWEPGPTGQGDPHEQITWMLEQISEQIKASSVASMQSIMQLVLSSRVTCDNCHNVSVGGLQDELAFSVPLKPRIKGGSLSSYLQKYMNETIQGYRCEKCKVVGDVHRSQSISHAPDILFVQLKRFDYAGRKDRYGLPIDPTLDLSPYRDPSGSKDSMEYELLASIMHVGNLSSGHYTCNARGSDGRWSCFDDGYHGATTLAKATCGDEPYLLIYQRKQT